jgi:hypothetical protein
MTTLKYANHFIEEENVITNQGEKVQIFHLIPENEEVAMVEWARNLRRNYADDQVTDEMSSSLGVSHEEYLKTYKFPDPLDTWGKVVMIGDFSEILIADYLQYVLDYVVPRTRYNSKINRNRSTQGSDLIAYNVASSDEWNPKDELLVFEVKAQSSEAKAKARLQEAVEHSSKDITRLAESLVASAEILTRVGKQNQAKVVQRFLNGTDRPYITRYAAAAVHSTFSFSRDLIQQLDTSQHPSEGVQLIVVHCDRLKDFINSMYERATKC